jgi:parallel beta-helix repeat protein
MHPAQSNHQQELDPGMAIFTVSNLHNSGAGSLRHAIMGANSDLSGTASVIDFSVNGSITLASALPAISRAVTIDATSAPTHTSGGPPVVELNCNFNAGLTFGAGSDGSKLLGLAIGDANGNGVTLNAGSVTLADNYIGLDTSGAAFGNSGDGISVRSTSSNNRIGLNPEAASGVVSNVISGNGGNGVSFHGSSGNTLVDNRIGTDPTGTTAVANDGNGIWLTDSSNGNEIGGTAFENTTTGAVNDPTGDKGTVAPVFVVPPLGNLVSGNGGDGILIDADSQRNILNGNFVGTTADGDGVISNTLDGVAIDQADNNSLIGCQFVDNPFVYYNVISANGGNGLRITDSDNTTVQANFFGAGADNTTILGNGGDGILVDGTSTNTQVGGVIPLGNVSAGNQKNGIEVAGTASGFITFNTFGGLLAFKGAAPNGNDGLLITSTGGNNTVQTNVFSGNHNDGIELSGDASGVTVDPNITGLNTDGNALLPNGNDGLEIDGTAHDNVVGGSQASVIPQNTFSGNTGYGVDILGSANNNQVLLSYIGLSAGGTAGLGNSAGGIRVGLTAHDNIIGGTSTPSAPTGNLISANGGNGVTLDPETSNIQVIDNSFGFTRFGAPTLPNAGPAIVASGSTNADISGNVIAVPSVIAVTDSPSDAVLGIGALATLTLHLDGAVTVAGGPPTLALNNGATATYVSGSASTNLNFDYTVALGQDTPDLAVSAIGLNGATVNDQSGDAADLSGAVANPPGILSIASIAAFDITTDQPVAVVGQTYAGPVAGLQSEYINITPDSLNITATSPNWFIHSGGGEDAIAVSSGTNVLDGGAGSNFLTGGSGTDTFYVDSRGATADVWSTVDNFHAGDAVVIWGITPSDFNFDFENDQGDAGYTGLTLHATAPGKPTASVTFAGFTTADLSSGRIAESSGIEPVSGSSYTYFHAIS